MKTSRQICAEIVRRLDELQAKRKKNPSKASRYVEGRPIAALESLLLWICSDENQNKK